MHVNGCLCWCQSGGGGANGRWAARVTGAEAFGDKRGVTTSLCGRRASGHPSFKLLGMEEKGGVGRNEGTMLEAASS